MRLLRDRDKRFVILADRGKGSHRMLYHPDIGGRARSMPLTWHGGKPLGKGLLQAIIRRFDLPKRFFG